MRCSLKNPVKILLIGAGGTGGYIAPHLYRIAYASGRSVRIIVADGDIVEQRNLIRQNFAPCDIGCNKAKVIAERYSTVFGIKTEYIPGFIEDKESLKKLLTPSYTYYYQPKEDVILIGAVDNNRTRQLCHEVFCCSNNLIYIDSGNGEFTGQIVCGLRRKGRTIAKPVAGLYPDIMSDEEKFPTELSCADRSVSAPQSIAANLFASTAVVAILYQLLILGKTAVKHLTFSSRNLSMKPILKKRG